jgi:WD40 repeat protein/DNA-binding SARP family transcriptional activator
MATNEQIEFRVLGPLAVRIGGRAVAVGGPKQRALLALLLLSANRVVARQRLIGELFAEQSVNSADHALRNHVSRLRKVLGAASADEPRLVARTPGYLLRVEPGELDLEHFERLVGAGREALAGGDPAGAAESFRVAESLWEGRPLADLELEPFARVEIDRLEELRLAAVEARVDAELALGHHSGLVSEVEALAREHPYRERFRAQLMLALYRSGRQAEGLEVYRRTRTLLNDELGLEPGVELQELERAILVQDPTLNPPSGISTRVQQPRVPVCPYKGLAPFEPEDVDVFFGRERLVEELTARLVEAPLLALVGPSGSGKSSLLCAGLVPALGGEYDLVRPSKRSAAGLADLLAHVPPGERMVVAVDQLEEVFADSTSEAERRALLDTLVDAAWDPERRFHVLLALRADFFGRLAPYVELADLVAANQVLLGPMTRAELRRAIRAPAEHSGLEVEQELVDELVDDVSGEAGALPLLSTALLDLWREREGSRLTLDAYRRIGGVRGVVERYAESAYRSLPVEEQRSARRILLRLVTGGVGETLTRRRVSRADLDLSDEHAARVLDVLIDRRLVVASEGTVELVHDALLEQWPRLRGWIEEDDHGRRLHGRLSEAASTWDAGGRDPGELYRGARLAAALEWAETLEERAGLSDLERAFLEASRIAHARATRRLRALLAVAVALLVAALVAGGAALAARGSAKRQATTAIAQRLGAQALVEPRLDRAFLLAREGSNLDDSAATRSNLLAALLRSPAALAVLRGRDDRVVDDAVSPDGRVLVFRGNNGSVSFFDTRTMREVGPPFGLPGRYDYYQASALPVRALAFSPDGRTLAVGGGDGRRSTLHLVDARTHRARSIPPLPSGETYDVAFAPDGRTLVTGEAISTLSSPRPVERLTLRMASDGSVLRRSGAIPGGRLIGFTAGGRYLLVTCSESISYLLDPRTFARVRTFQLDGTAALSPVADTAAFGQDDGSVKLLDLRSGAVRPIRRRATGGVIGVGFSRDGKALATTSDDGSVDVWDVPAASLRETFTGHAASAAGPVFSPDGATLYTAAGDGSVIAWDVRGTRRLGRPFRFAPVAQGGEGAHAPPHVAAVAVAVSPDSSLFVTSPGQKRVTLWRARDLAVVGELRGPVTDLQSLAWSHDGRLVAATGNGGDTVVWDVRTMKIVKLLGPGGPGGTVGVNFSADDRLLGTSGQDGTVRLYDVGTGTRDVGTGTRIATLKSKPRRETCLMPSGRCTLQDLDFSSDGRRIAAAGLADDISIWDLGRRTLERTIHHHDPIMSIRFSPDGKRIATGDLAGNVHFWDAATGRQVGRTLGGQNGSVWSVTYSPNGDEVMTTSDDGKVRLWDLATGKLVGAPLPGADTGGWGTFFPDGTQVVATFWSGTGVVWNVNPEAWREHACRVANRSLTPAEWENVVPERRYRRICG